MKILVATDFSQQASAAADAAAALARRLGDGLVLAHVLEVPPPGVLLAGPLVTGDYVKELRSHVEGELAAEAKRLRAAGFDVDVELLEGVAADALAALAKRLDVRMIVLGTHGRRALARAALGSFADAVAAGADRPAVVVRGDAAGLVKAAPGRDRPLRVLCALDGSRASDAAIAAVRLLRKGGPCDVTFGHCYWPPGEYQRLGLFGARSLVEADVEVVEVLERELREKVGSLPGDGSVAFRIGPGLGRPAEYLARWAEEAGADLLVAGSHGRHGLARLWHGSTARDLLHVSSIPVMVAPGLAEARPEARIPPLRVVLAATDLSASGDRAVLQAYAQLAAGGRVELCHVVERVPGAAGDGSLSPERRAELESRLRSLVPPDAAGRGVSTHVHLVEARAPGEGIVQAAERLSADAIVVGSHGRTGLSKALLGSVAEDVVRRAHRPVTVVREPAA